MAEIRDTEIKYYDDTAGTRWYSEQTILNADPTLAPGWFSPAGSIGQYQDGAGDDGRLYLKTGPAATDWRLIGKDTKIATAVIANAAAGDVAIDGDYLDPGDGSMIIQAFADGYRDVVLRPGTWTLTNTIDMTTSFRIRGMQGTLVQPPANGIAFEIDPIIVQGDAQGVRISDLMIQLGPQTTGIQVNALGNIEISSIFFIGLGTGGDDVGIVLNQQAVMGDPYRGVLRIFDCVFADVTIGVASTNNTADGMYRNVHIDRCLFQEFEQRAVSLQTGDNATWITNTTMRSVNATGPSFGVMMNNTTGLFMKMTNILVTNGGNALLHTGGNPATVIAAEMCAFNSSGDPITGQIGTGRAVDFVNGLWNCNFSNCNFVANGAESFFAGPNATAATLLFFRDCYFFNQVSVASLGWHNVEIQQAWGGSAVTGCYFNGGDSSLAFTGSVGNGTIQTSAFTGFNQAGIEASAWSGGIIGEVFFINASGFVAGSEAISILNSALYLHIDQMWYFNIDTGVDLNASLGANVVAGVSIQQLTWGGGLGGHSAAIRLNDGVGNSEQIRITDCNIVRCTDGIILNGNFTNVVIHGNNIFDITGSGGSNGGISQVNGSLFFASIQGNTVQRAAGFGMHFNNVNTSTIQGNMVSSGGGFSDINILNGIDNVVAFNHTMSGNTLCQLAAGTSGSRVVYNNGTIVDSGANTLVGNF